MKNKKFKWKNKSQLKIQEMAFMLVAVVIFFVMVGLFAITFIYMDIHKKANEAAEIRTLSGVTSLADSPEFSCVSSKSNCIDGDKVITLMNKSDYKNFWPFSSLRVIRYVAFDKTEDKMVKCNLANYPDCDIIVIYDKNVTNEKSVSSFVAFCRKKYESYENFRGYTYDKCEIAKLVAGSEIKQPDVAKTQ